MHSLDALSTPALITDSRALHAPVGRIVDTTVGTALDGRALGTPVGIALDERALGTTAGITFEGTPSTRQFGFTR